MQTVAALVSKHNVDLIAIGNGTASRETDTFVADLIKRGNLKVQKSSSAKRGLGVFCV